MTDQELLDAALHGGEVEWAELHKVCHDRIQAEILARMLEEHTTEENNAAAAWAEVLSELHPGLKISLIHSRPV